MNDILKSCTLCPRECKVNRYEHKGFCGETAKVRIARAELHMWEEPCISGTEGSGTVFLSGCCLKCCFCQNYEISAEGKGFELTEQELADTFLRLQSMGANNINLVNPTHFVPQIIKALDRIVKFSRANVPFIPNTDLDFNEYFKDIVGVTLPEDHPVAEEVLLKFDEARFPYVVNKPIHPSQEIEDEEQHIVKLTVRPNKELEARIFSYGNQVEVLKPEWLRRQIAEKIENLLKKYSTVQKDCNIE